MNDLPPAGRDPQRLFSAAQKASMAARQHHLCAVCGRDLPETFHAHHVIQWADGGRTCADNGIAVCPDCHRHAPVRQMPQFTPRAWQAEALPEILPILRHGAFATLNAAPGAGKTLFTGWAFQNLLATGDVARMVLFVPNGHLRGQHAEKLAEVGIYLDIDTVTERSGRLGVVLTYHVLSNPEKVQAIIRNAEETPTLFVLDEVHHLALRRQEGYANAWALHSASIVGSVKQPLHPVLNLSGTLFRSKPGERIATCRYNEDLDSGQIEIEADYSVTAGRLIDEKQLRHIKVLAYDADMSVTAVDLASEVDADATMIRAVDLDAEPGLRSTVLPGMIRDPRFVGGIIDETISRLGHASAALRGAPVKGLILADGVTHAEQIYAALREHRLGTSQAFIVHGERSSPEKTITSFRQYEGQAILVSVRMVAEGFDVPDVCVLTYLTAWSAPLFINQMAGRAMRITDREHALKNILPAAVIIPNDGRIKAAFADVLVGAMRVLEAPPVPCPRCGAELCICPPQPIIRPRKECPACEMPWRLCICICRACGKSPYAGCQCRPKWASKCDRCWQTPCVCDCDRCWQTPCVCSRPRLTGIEVMSDPELAHVTVDGDEISLHLVASIADSLREYGLPEAGVEQTAAALQRKMDQDPMAFLAYFKDKAADES